MNTGLHRTGGTDEFLCVFDDDRTEWLPIPQNQFLFQSYEQDKQRIEPVLEQKGTVVFEKMSDFVSQLD
jgi:hypothetical protein